MRERERGRKRVRERESEGERKRERGRERVDRVEKSVWAKDIKYEVALHCLLSL